MRAFAVTLILSVAWVAAGAPAAAQEGHPLKGSWLGTWGPSQTHSPDIVLVLDWDGKAISGTINPGIDAMPIRNATLNPDGWVFRFEADGKDRAGNAVHYVVEGKIENLPFHNRTVTGTWKSATESGQFQIQRQ
jgi:hypothetical protein